MATKKKTDKPAAPKKPAAKKADQEKVYTGEVQAWERGKSVKCAPDTSK